MNSDKGKKLDQSVQYLKSVGPRRAESFKKIGIETIRDLLFYLPSRHLDRTTVLTAAKAFEYCLNGYDGELTVMGKVVDKEKKRLGKRELLKIQFRDETGFFECVWFNAAKYFFNVFNEGDHFAISSRPEKSKYGGLQFVHPDFDRITEKDEINFLNTGKIIPFYKIPKELRATNIGDFSLRKIISNAVNLFCHELEESLPDYIVNQNKLISLNAAVENYHFPQSQEDLLSAKQRFKFEEVFYLEILVALRKANYKENLEGNKFKIKSTLVSNFLKSLPFKLTNSQLKVLSEIKNDVLSGKPMNRLLQGDVGSGKTVVALITMLIAVDSGYQAALMAPTEILADQHAKNISFLMKKLFEIDNRKQVKVTLLTGGQKKSDKEKNLEEIELQQAEIIVGTHALFEEKVKFKNLSLVVIDEQHRFGVKQRGLLQAKGKMPHILIMSATPIPRTLTMTVYGDLDLSVIDEMPKNRKPVITALRGESKLKGVYKFINDLAKEGYQTFIVYPLVEESEKLELKAAETYYKKLGSDELKGLNVALIHGRMKWQEKEEIMFLFKNKYFDVLVSTTVIEVGIDIPDANIIVINDAQRFGLAQLHQLRGRVGRSSKQAYCILITNDNLAAVKEGLNLNFEYYSSSQIEKYKSIIRLQAMVNTNNGFEIAETDLKLRGPGDIFGTKQIGFPELNHADIVQDSDLIATIKNIAFKIIDEDEKLFLPANNLIKTNLIKKYSSSLKYSLIA